jgi:hypothetical protein
MQIRRLLADRKGLVLAAVAVIGIVVPGAITALVGPPKTRDQVATVEGDAAKRPGLASGGSTEAFGAAQVAPAPPDTAGATPVVPGSPRIVRTADVRVKVGKGGFGGAFDRVAAVAAVNGGFVSSSSTASVDKARSGELTVRVPADRFDAMRQALGELGRVESQSIRGDDVSAQLVDYDARLKNLQAQEDALRVLVGQAKAVGDVLQVQSSLFTVRQQIEQLKAQKANLEQAAALATIHVSLFEPGAPAVYRPADEDRSLGHSFRRAVDGTVAVVGGTIVVVGYLGPLAVLGGLGWGASRVFRRRPPAPAQAPAV